MNDRRPITEDDILLTEMLIARSYGNLKRSVVRTSSEAIGSIGDSISGSVGGTIRKHPYATAGAAVGLGIVLFGLVKMMSRGGSSKKKRTEDGRRRSSDMGMEIISMITPLLMPYVSAYLQKYLGQALSKKHNA